MGIVHHNDNFLANAEYFFRLGTNLCYNPLLHEYIQQIHAFKLSTPLPMDLPMQPENMPYYSAPHVQSVSESNDSIDST